MRLCSDEMHLCRELHTLPVYLTSADYCASGRFLCLFNKADQRARIMQLQLESNTTLLQGKASVCFGDAKLDVATVRLVPGRKVGNSGVWHLLWCRAYFELVCAHIVRTMLTTAVDLLLFAQQSVVLILCRTRFIVSPEANRKFTQLCSHQWACRCSVLRLAPQATSASFLCTIQGSQSRLRTAGMCGRRFDSTAGCPVFKSHARPLAGRALSALPLVALHHRTARSKGCNTALSGT